MRIIPKKTLTGSLVEWDDQRGFGFLQAGSARVFLHRREFAALHKRPEIGDSFQFSVGLDARGRTCAKNATHLNDGGKLTFTALFTLVFLLVTPIMASLRRGIAPAWIAGFLLTFGTLAYFAYSADKRKAKEGRWRTPESTLHLLEALGGWPGAFVAQRKLRHKVSKASYQFVFWLIVVAYQFVAVDSLMNWKLSNAALARLERVLETKRQ